MDVVALDRVALEAIALDGVALAVVVLAVVASDGVGMVVVALVVFRLNRLFSMANPGDPTLLKSRVSVSFNIGVGPTPIEEHCKLQRRDPGDSRDCKRYYDYVANSKCSFCRGIMGVMTYMRYYRSLHGNKKVERLNTVPVYTSIVHTPSGCYPKK